MINTRARINLLTGLAGHFISNNIFLFENAKMLYIQYFYLQTKIIYLLHFYCSENFQFLLHKNIFNFQFTSSVLLVTNLDSKKRIKNLSFSIQILHAYAFTRCLCTFLIEDIFKRFITQDKQTK